LTGELNTQRFTMDAFFKEFGNLQVPLYQRGYDWQTNQVDEMMDDLSEVIDEKQDAHFFGLIVLNSDAQDKKKYVIDGQQRITTSFIFLAVVRNEFSKLNEKNHDAKAEVRADDLQDNYFGERGSYRFGQSKDLNDYFERNIMNKNTFSDELSSKQSSEKNVFHTYDTIRKWVNGKLSEEQQPNEKVKLLYRILNSFLENFYVITLSTTSRSDAFVIFETLNDRGTELSASDLLKNHLLRISGDDIDEVKKYWDLMVDSLNGGAKNVTKFVRSYWNSKNDFTTEKLLYKKIYTKVQNRADAKSLIVSLNNLAPVYSAISEPKTTEYFSNAELNKELIALSDFGVKTYYPVILALSENGYSDSDILKVVHKITSFVVRNFTIGGLVANKYEKTFSKIAIDINKGTYESIDDINNDISKDTVSDDKFRIDFGQAQVKTEKASKHILADIFYSDEIEKVDMDNVKVLNINKNISDPDLLGNKVLVTKNESGRIKQAPSRKFDILRESKFSYTSKMAENRNITEDEVKEIQAENADYAVSFWK